MKRLTHTVILCLCASGAFAFDDTPWTGFHSGAWPSDTHYKMASTNDLVVVTNLAGKLHVVVWTQASTTNIIPTIDAWGGSSYYGPITGAVGVSSRGWTNEYLTDLAVDLSDDTLAEYADTNTLTNTYEWLDGGVTQTLTTILTDTMSGTNLANMVMDVVDLWSYDSYLMRTERYMMKFDLTNRVEQYGDDFAPKFYHQSDNLYWANMGLMETLYVINQSASEFVDMRFAIDNEISNSYFVAGAGIPKWPSGISTELCAYVGCPTNWFDRSYATVDQVWRDLGGAEMGVGHIVTTAFTMAYCDDTLCTNTVEDYCGNSIQLIGSNGQEFTFICTNQHVQAGFHERDYTYYHVPGLASALVWNTSGDESWTSDSTTNWIEWQGTGQTYAVAVATFSEYSSSDADGAPQSYATVSYSRVYKSWFIEGRTVKSKMIIDPEPADTQWAQAPTFYCKFNFGGSATTNYFIMPSFGTYYSNTLYKMEKWDDADAVDYSSVTTTAFIGTLNAPTIPPDPTTYYGTNQSSSISAGWVAENGQAILRYWPVTDGFDYP